MTVKFNSLSAGLVWFVFILGYSAQQVLEESNEGTHFLLSMFRHGSNEEKSMILIQNPHSTSVNVSARHNMTTAIDGDEWMIGPEDALRIKIPQEYGLDIASQIANTGIEIVSTNPIKISTKNIIQSLPDKSTGVFPYVQLGIQYSVITQCRTNHKYMYSKVHIVSSSGKTNVQVGLPGEKHTHFLTLRGKNYYGGDKINEELEEYSVLQLTSLNSLSGATILSSDSISVFTGCDFTFMDYSISQTKDQFYHNFEHMMDDTRLGRNFDFVTVAESNITVIAPFGNTTVVVSVNESCEVLSLMNETELDEKYFPPGLVITAHSNNPILVSVETGRGLNTLLTPREQGVSKTSFCGNTGIEVKFLLYGLSGCAQNFSINSNLMELGHDIFEQNCYDENKRCFFTSRAYVFPSQCYTVMNECGVFFGSVQIGTGTSGGVLKEKSLGNAMLTIPPSCSTLQNAPQTNNCEDVEVLCELHTTTISSNSVNSPNVVSCENNGHKYTSPGGEQQCFWETSTYFQYVTDAAEECVNKQGSLAVIPDVEVSLHIANLIMLKRLEADWFYVGYKLLQGKIRRLTDNGIQTWANWAPGSPSASGDVAVHILTNTVYWYTSTTAFAADTATRHRALCMLLTEKSQTSNHQIKAKRTTPSPTATTTTKSLATTTTTMAPATTTSTMAPHVTTTTKSPATTTTTMAPHVTTTTKSPATTTTTMAPHVATTTTKSPATTTTTMAPATTTTTMAPATTTTTMAPATTTTTNSPHVTTTTTPIITTTPSNASKGMTCNCTCAYNGVVNLTSEILEEINKMKKELQVDKATLSSTIRSKTSAPDPRPSSRYVGGTLAIVFTTMSFGGILLLDLPFYTELFQRVVVFLKRAV